MFVSVCRHRDRLPTCPGVPRQPDEAPPPRDPDCRISSGRKRVDDPPPEFFKLPCCYSSDQQVSLYNKASHRRGTMAALVELKQGLLMVHTLRCEMILFPLKSTVTPQHVSPRWISFSLLLIFPLGFISSHSTTVFFSLTGDYYAEFSLHLCQFLVIQTVLTPLSTPLHYSTRRFCPVAPVKLAGTM